MANGRPVAAILFDKDGTLIDFDRTWGPAAYEVMRQLAGHDEAALERLIDVSHYEVETLHFRRTSPLVAGSSAIYGPLWADALGRTDIDQVCRDMDDAFRREGLKSLAPIRDPAAIAGGLRQRGLRLGIASNDAERSVQAQAAALGLSGLMDFIAGYDSGYGSKPDPRMVTAFCAALDLAPPAVIVVGDSIHDLAAARAAGAVSVAVLSGPAPRHELEPLADHVIDDIGDLDGLVTRLGTVEA